MGDAQQVKESNWIIKKQKEREEEEIKRERGGTKARYCQ